MNGEAHYRAGANAQSESEYETDEENWEAGPGAWSRMLRPIETDRLGPWKTLDQHVEYLNQKHFLCKSTPWKSNMMVFHWFSKKDFSNIAFFQLAYLLFQWKKSATIRFTNICGLFQVWGAATKNWVEQQMDQTVAPELGIGANGAANRLTWRVVLSLKDDSGRLIE